MAWIFLNVWKAWERQSKWAFTNCPSFRAFLKRISGIWSAATATPHLIRSADWRNLWEYPLPSYSMNPEKLRSSPKMKRSCWIATVISHKTKRKACCVFWKRLSEWIYSSKIFHLIHLITLNCSSEIGEFSFDVNERNIQDIGKMQISFLS